MFVSYSDDTPQHAARVLELAQWLRTHGIDAHIDQFEESPEEGWPRWVYTQVRESEYVLVVCTRGYLERCEGEVPRGRAVDLERSVQFESHLTLQEIHDAEGRNSKFIPLVFHGDDIGECVPLPLRSATHYRLPDQRDDLYRRLSDQPKIRAVPLGALRTYDDDSHDAIAVDPSTASQSLEALVVEDEPPPKRRKRAWSSGQLQRLMIVGAFGLAFLTTALFINGTLTTAEGVGLDGEPTCRIELTDPNGGAINSDFITVELPAGQEIEFKIENGNTLRFKCPTLAVQARVRVNPNARAGSSKQGIESAGDAVSTAPNAKADSGYTLESTFMIQAEPGVQTVRLGEAPQELAEPTPSQPAPADSGSVDSISLDSGSGSGLGSSLGSGSGDPIVDQQDVGSKSSTRRKTKVELSLAPPDAKLERSLKAKLTRLEACVPKAPKSPVQVTCEIQQDASGAIVNVMVNDAQLRKLDREAADCAKREIDSWALGDTKYDPSGPVAKVTLRFGAR